MKLWGPYGPTRLDDLPYMTQEVVSKLMEYSLETGALAPYEGNGHHPDELGIKGMDYSLQLSCMQETLKLLVVIFIS